MRFYLLILISGCSALVLSVLILASGIDAGLFSGTIQTLATRKAGREVRFEHLEAHLLARDPSATVIGLSIASPVTVSHYKLLQVKRLDVHFRILPLLVGHLDPTSLVAQAPFLHLVRLPDGRTNFRFHQGVIAAMLRKVGFLQIIAGKLQVDDGGHLFLRGSFAHDPSEKDIRAFQLKTTGVATGAPISVEMAGNPLNKYRTGAPYPLTATVVDGLVRIHFSGTSAEPLELSRYDLRVQAAGPNLADLRYVFPIKTPNSGPFQLEGEVLRDGGREQFRHIRGKIGGSRLAADLLYDKSQKRPQLEISLQASRLRYEDATAMLAPVPPHAIARVSSGEASARGRNYLDSRRLLSATSLPGSDLEVSLRVEQFEAPSIPTLKRLEGQVHSVAGNQAAAMLHFQMGNGKGTLRANLEMSKPVPRLALSGEVRGLRLSSVDSGLVSSIDGTLNGSIRFQGNGPSLQAVENSGTGKASFSLTNGLVARSKAEALAGDTAKAIGLSLADSGEKTELPCAVMNLSMARGVIRPQLLKLVSGTGISTGEGYIDLNRGYLALEFHGEPAHKPWLSLNAPITLKGPVRQPKIHVEVGQGLEKGGLGGVLALALAPFGSARPATDASASISACAPLLDAAARFAR